MRSAFDGWTVLADLTMLPIGEIVRVKFPRMVWDDGPWMPRGFMLSDKEPGPFKLESA